MFEKTSEELHEIGGYNTTVEIKQQPELWLDTLNIYRENLEAIESFLADARAMGEGRLSVVFTGAAPPTRRRHLRPLPPSRGRHQAVRLQAYRNHRHRLGSPRLPEPG